MGTKWDAYNTLEMVGLKLATCPCHHSRITCVWNT